MKNTRIIILLPLFIVFLAGCKRYDNFTTYFNTYYNMERLLHESEDEFDYQTEKLRVMPVVLVPEPDIYKEREQLVGPPPFMRNIIVSKKIRQPVEVKLDSILIKGSKIMARHAKSNYIEGTLYLMAQAYFYKEEWLPAQIKCSELIDKFPAGELSPDAHLLLSKSLLIQRKFYAGKIWLSRTVDIAWQLRRYDILSEAFRIEAELALYEQDKEGALRPYKQAIAQSDNNKMSAKWQSDIGALLYRMSDFKRAQIEFKKVFNYSPDYLTFFESKLYQAASLIRMGVYDEAEIILDDLYNDGKFTEWKGYVAAERLHILRLQNVPESQLLAAERIADSTFTNNAGLSGYYFQRGVQLFDSNDYNKAITYFGRARNHALPIYQTAYEMYTHLNNLATKKAQAMPSLQDYNAGKLENDTLRNDLALIMFDIGRIQENLDNPDSAKYYYKTAVGVSPPANKASARYIYAYTRMIREDDPYAADSLLEVLATNYNQTDYGREAMQQLGFTDAFMIDSVADLYYSGSDLRMHREFVFAINQFYKIFERYPRTSYAPKALYGIGWIYEKDLKNIDSAVKYYQLLVDNYPDSEYAKDVRLGLTYLYAINSGEPIPDSLRTRSREVFQSQQKDGRVITDPENINMAPDPNLPPDLQRAPQQFLEQGKELLNQPKKMLENLKMPKNPFKNLFGSPDEEKAPDDPNLVTPPEELQKEVEEEPKEPK